MRFNSKRLAAWAAVAIALLGGAYRVGEHVQSANDQQVSQAVHQNKRASSANKAYWSSAKNAGDSAKSALKNKAKSMAGANTYQSTDDNSLAYMQFQNGSTGIVQVNHGQPTLHYIDFQTPQIKYTQLDRLNRAGMATAYLTKANLGRSAGRGRQVWKPTGWHNQPKYVNGKRVFPQNRGHLIAYTMTFNLNKDGKFQRGALGSEDNPLNLATQSAYSNQVLMQVYEQQVRDALAQGQKVNYQVAPVFKGNELMPRGYHLQAVSDTGQLKFNVYLQNIQPGIRFNYQTGQSQVDPSVKVNEAAVPHR